MDAVRVLILTTKDLLTTYSKACDFYAPPD